MPDSGLRFAVNCSILFTELPLLERPAAARAAGFDAVEFWWPWPEQPVPPDKDADAFARAVRNAGVALVGLNFFAGELPGPDCGAAAVPALSRQFRDNVDAVVEIGAGLGTRMFNALYGNRVPGTDPAGQDDLATANLALAAAAAGRVGGTVLIEPVSGPKPYPLRTAADALAVADRVAAASGAGNVALLADLYHLAVNGDDPALAVAAHAGRIGHVQLADAPGRHQPGTGSLPLRGYLASLRRYGYQGWVGLEYIPAGPSADSFGWLAREWDGEVGW